MGKRMSYYLKSTIVFALLLCSLLAVKVNVQARTLNVNEMKENFSTLQSQYPTGQKWNGSFQGAWQCHGFGLLVFDRLFQTKANDLPIISNPSDFFVGDLVRFKNGSYNHTFVITDIIDNTIYYVDCNSDNRNTVVWGHTISKDRVRTLINQPLLPGFGDNTLTSGYVKHQDGNNITSLTQYDTEAPVISNVQITDVNKDGYTVTCTVTDNVGIDRVEFPSWFNAPGETYTDIKGELNGNTTSCRINVNDLGGREGTYITYINAYDKNGNIGSYRFEIGIDRSDPEISNVQVTERTADGYTITCNVTDPSGIDRVMFPSWLNEEGQTDKWYQGTLNGNTATFHVDINDLAGKEGMYFTNIVAYDKYDNFSKHRVEVFVDRTAPEISNVKISDVNSEGYTVSCDVKDNDAVDNVKFPSWFNGLGETETWFVGKLENGHASYRINVKDLGGKEGTYITYIRAYDKSGNIGSHRLDVYIKRSSSINVTGVTLKNTEVKFNSKNAVVNLYATISPANATNKTVTWKSSNPSVATVDQNGKVTAVSNGTANITVTTQDGNKAATCKVTVNIPKPVEPTKPVTPDKPSVSATSIKLNKPSLTLYKGKTYTLKATVKPKTYNSGIKWSSSASKYATVSSKGKITAKKSGRTVITAQTKSGKKATCIIKVKERKATKVKLSRKNLTLKVGRKYALKATVYPKNATDTKKWTINKKGIVKVSSKGVVTGLKKGKCRITLKTSSGKSAYCNVKVE
ncbi:Ig-like domain-containing protein [uncultured Robinsoniella sp.]|uniref:Ig-like domain-containing protein n=1 Tax=uncultured Robinsoniella sp. TaxID=904190 RepID=UPI00374EEFE6